MIQLACEHVAKLFARKKGRALLVTLLMVEEIQAVANSQIYQIIDPLKMLGFLGTS